MGARGIIQARAPELQFSNMSKVVLMTKIAAQAQVQANALQRTWFKLFFRFLAVRARLDQGALVLLKRDRNYHKRRLEAFFQTFGSLPAVVANPQDIQTYLNLERMDLSQQLSKDEFLKGMFMEMVELLEIQPIFSYDSLFPTKH
jgi:hypothetical protein